MNAKFTITNESSEDTFGTTDDIQEAIQIAKEVAQTGPIGDLVLIEHEGKGIKQFSLTENGVVEYQC